ncbi:hypothetical protein BLNAU_24250 [Blattamonas nauphoetae]|uniref:Uncharacterized protein n=1 Tax=Blattamonas nauphoetae TaxID=2049346 RepID=A0ABQ9WMY1_9EUKA|nr:hypothetical protein BLNAU_24250 [Blattamonas nauphoetae]
MHPPSPPEHDENDELPSIESDCPSPTVPQTIDPAHVDLNPTNELFLIQSEPDDVSVKNDSENSASTVVKAID